MSPGAWARRQTAGTGAVRNMFEEGRRLRAQHGDENVFDLSLGQPLDEPPEAVRQALRRATVLRGRERFGYLPSLGLPAARERAAADVADERVTAECVCITAGAAGALVVAIRAFVDAGDEVLGVIPYFGEYRQYVEAIGAAFRPVGTDPQGVLDLEAIAGALTERTRAIILNSPNNPSGHTTSFGELVGIAGVLHEHECRTGQRVLVLIDEVYHKLTYDGLVAPNALAAYDETVLARSYSKDLGLAGERIGFLALHPTLATSETLAALATCQRAMGFVHASATMQHMIADLDDWSVDLSLHQHRRDHIVDCARRAGLDCVPPSGGLYLWMRSPWDDAGAFIDALRARRVLSAPGRAFGAASHIRLCFSAPEHAVERALEIAGEVAQAGAGTVATG